MARGLRITGSDRYADKGDLVPVLQKLRRGGVELVPQDGSGVRRGTAGVVVSTAIEEDNPDLVSAAQLGVTRVHRSELLADLMRGGESVAVTGTSGKSTVTGMIGWILESVGFDPTVVNGAPLRNWLSDTSIGNARTGKSDLWVIEADESDRSLLSYSPMWAVITNVSKDHFGIEDTRELLRSFEERAARRVVGSLDGESLYSTFQPRTDAGCSRFGYGNTEFTVPVPGAHNARNALCAVVLCEQLGCSLPDIARALASFEGISRRLETIGRAGGVTVVDDYAHNPAKISSAWESLVPHAERILAIWRPHGYGPLRAMLRELADTFASLCGGSDRVWFLPVYDAGGTADRGIGPDDIVASMEGRCRGSVTVASTDAVVREVGREARRGDVVLVMGARDPHLPELARRILRVVAGTHPGSS